MSQVGKNIEQETVQETVAIIPEMRIVYTREKWRNSSNENGRIKVHSILLVYE